MAVFRRADTAGDSTITIAIYSPISAVVITGMLCGLFRIALYIRYARFSHVVEQPVAGDEVTYPEHHVVKPYLLKR